MNLKDFQPGLYPSPPDSRDYLLSSFIPAIKRYPESLPPLFDLDVLDQKSEPSCVGFSLAGMKQFNEIKEKTYKIFDGSWIYAECKKIDGMPNFPGTYLRSGLEVVRNIGAKPVNENDPSIYRIKSYAKNDDNTFEGIKKALVLYGTVLAGFTGSNQGWSKEIVRAPLPGESTWGHAVFLVGYEKDYLIGQNSWGKARHNQGLFKVHRTYLPFESWTIILDKINESRTPVKTGWVARNWISNNATTANLNVREMPGTNHRIIEILPRGTKINTMGSPDIFATGFWWRELIL
jgi:hypothetical protein